MHIHVNKHVCVYVCARTDTFIDIDQRQRESQFLIFHVHICAGTTVEKVICEQLKRCTPNLMVYVNE
jgi:hypothetical protein